MAVNLAFIWGNSMLPGAVSGALSDWLRESIAMILLEEGMAPSGGGLLRKAAHFTAFASLGMLLTWRMGMTGRKPVKAAGMALLPVLRAACVGDAVQIFTPGRIPA